MPAVYSAVPYVRGGGLLSYGANGPPPMSIASCAARSRATSRCSFRPSLRWPCKTAKALGLAIPPSIMLRADEALVMAVIGTELG
jgi:hypothetical protein